MFKNSVFFSKILPFVR